MFMRLEVILRGKNPFNKISIDGYLTEVMCGQVDHWLRTEHLAEDFIRVMSEFGPISDEQRDAIRKVRINVAPNGYERDIWKVFTRDEVKQLYESCPLWASIEKEVYGSLLA
jgi:hypothetical protein